MKSLVECAMRAIMGNVDAVDSLGELPFRLAKPILMVMTAEKLVEIETNSPVCVVVYVTATTAPNTFRSCRAST